MGRTGEAFLALLGDNMAPIVDYHGITRCNIIHTFTSL